MSEALAAKLKPKIIEACAQFIRSDPETLRQVVGSIMGVKIPRKTSDDMVRRSSVTTRYYGGSGRRPACSRLNATAALRWT